MAMFVHLTPAVNVARVKRSGIRAVSWAQDGARGVYCFPVLPSYTLTHAWLRELSRHGGPGNLVAVHLRLPDAEPVRVGHYSGHGAGAHQVVTAGEAVRRVGALDDPRGWEVFVPRAVRAAEVHRVRPVSQAIGWRYRPGAHGTRPCTCDGCRVRGAYGSRRLRERLLHPLDGPAPPAQVLLARVEAAGDPGDPAVLCDALYWFGLRRRGPLHRLAPLAGHPDAAVRAALVHAVADWSTPGVDALLDRLADDPERGVREAVGFARR
ncbi:HEAT repeat domain-containing protein [Streptomyces avicenniae]|uniref:HEAT repeat domain-containing protein n=1 Tax=Streptomyces avicenniae TaxID=500153 RepID=UPI00167D4CBC|nr:HEAT repeat domain-containing protein [Streptomyces avicenniae]